MKYRAHVPRALREIARGILLGSQWDVFDVVGELEQFGEALAHLHQPATRRPGQLSSYHALTLWSVATGKEPGRADGFDFKAFARARGRDGRRAKPKRSRRRPKRRRTHR